MNRRREKDQETIAELEARISALTAALQKEHAAKAAVERSAQTAEKARKAAEAALQQAIRDKVAAEDDVRRLQAFVATLKENLDIKDLMIWAKSSEKLTDADLKKLRKELAKTVMNPDKVGDQDIAEASTPEDAPQAEEKPVITPAQQKKRRGRQPGVRTSGRDMQCFNLLSDHVVVQDLKQECEDRSYAESLVFVKEEQRQQLDFVRGHFRSRVTKTYIYRDQDNHLVSFKQKLAPDFVKGGKMTNGAAAAVIVDKVIWSLPLYRQAKRINLIGGGKLVNAQLLNSYFLRAAHTVTSVWEALLGYIKSQRAIHGDETRLLVVNDTHTGNTAAERKKNLGYVWAVSYQGKQAPAAYYTYYASREGK
jgi:transposase